MAYEKHTWTTGEVITAGKLNNMEDGIAGGTLVIGGFNYDDNSNLVGTSDKTWQEIDNALAAGARCVVVITNDNGHAQTRVGVSEESGGTYIIDLDGSPATTTSADGYPTIDGSSIN